MSRLIATVVIAALLFTGTAVSVPARTGSNEAPPAVSQPATTAPAVENPAPTILTAEEAVAIALEHAGLTAEEVTKVRTEKDWDDGILEWDVEFRHGDWEFDYEIHAETGEIRKWDKDYDPIKNPKPNDQPVTTEPAPSEPVVTDPAPTEPVTTTLTAEEAVAIALEHAGLTAEEVTKVRTEKDRDDGILEWDVEFRHGDWEYDYEIHAATGEIRKWDKEYDPPKGTKPADPPAPTEPPATEPVPATLTAEEAIAIALEHAGLTAEEVTKIRTEKDRDNGVLEWEVEFRVGRWEYEYEINAETGEILHSEKEWDD